MSNGTSFAVVFPRRIDTIRVIRPEIRPLRRSIIIVHIRKCEITFERFRCTIGRFESDEFRIGVNKKFGKHSHDFVRFVTSFSHCRNRVFAQSCLGVFFFFCQNVRCVWCVTHKFEKFNWKSKLLKTLRDSIFQYGTYLCYKIYFESSKVFIVLDKGMNIEQKVYMQMNAFRNYD